MTLNKEKIRKVGIVLIIAGASAMLVVVFFIFFGSKLFLNPSYEFEKDQTAPDTVETVDYSDESISIPGVDSITIKADTKKVSVNIYNPENNNCYFEVSIILNDGNEEIYKSKLIKPGQSLYEIELNRQIQKGTYNAALHYNTYTMDGNYTPLNGANVPFELIAE